MGIHQAVYAMGMFAGPWIGGMLSDALGIRAMFGIMAGFCLAVASPLVVLNQRRTTVSYTGVGAPKARNGYQR